MHRKIAAILAGIALVGVGSTGAAAGYLAAEAYPGWAMHDAPFYQKSVRGPHVIGRYAPRIAIPPARFYDYPYVSAFGSCVRWRRVPAHSGWRSHRVWACS